MSRAAPILTDDHVNRSVLQDLPCDLGRTEVTELITDTGYQSSVRYRRFNFTGDFHTDGDRLLNEKG